MPGTKCGSDLSGALRFSAEETWALPKSFACPKKRQRQRSRCSRTQIQRPSQHPGLRPVPNHLEPHTQLGDPITSAPWASPTP